MKGVQRAMAKTYGVWVGDSPRLLARIIAPGPDAADVAALKAVDDALTSETPPAALRNPTSC